MTKYAIRISQDNENNPSTIQLQMLMQDDHFKDQQILIVQEHVNNENKHYHFYAEYQNAPSLRNMLSRKLNIKGKNRINIKESDSDFDKYITYICKGNSITEQPIVIYNNTTIDIEEQHQLYYDNQKDYKDNKKKDRTTIYQDIEILINEYIQTLEDINYDIDPVRITKIILDYYKTNNKTLVKHYISTLVETFVTRHSTHYEDIYIDNICRNLRSN